MYDPPPDRSPLEKALTPRHFLALTPQLHWRFSLLHLALCWPGLFVLAGRLRAGDLFLGMPLGLAPRDLWHVAYIAAFGLFVVMTPFWGALWAGL